MYIWNDAVGRFLELVLEILEQGILQTLGRFDTLIVLGESWSSSGWMLL